MRSGRWTSLASIAVCALLVLAGVARGASVDEQPLKFSPSAAVPAEPSAAAPTAGAASGTRMVMALGLVLIIILGLKWSGQRLLVRRGIVRPNAAVRVIGRTPLAPKQQILLLQVGRRVLVVADSHGRMNALSEINEPDEVATLLGNSPSSGDATERNGRFGSALRRAAEPFGADVPGLAGGSEVNDGNPDRPDSPDVNGLLDRVREMRQQFKSA